MVIKNHSNLQTTTASYLQSIYTDVLQRSPHEVEFHQAVKSLLDSIAPMLSQHPNYIKTGVLERLVEPERMITFRVPWLDDQGNVHVNRGFRVQFNSAIGPYKGGLRFHPSVNSSIMNFLGFTQTIKNALTGQAIGGAKGGADFDPKGKSDLEIMRFCQSYMAELAHYIGADLDIPAGDIGVGAREIGYLFGQYRRVHRQFEAGVFTGKGVDFGGSHGRTEATGYGTIYFVRQMLKQLGDSLNHKTVIVSGSGNVSIFAIEKAIELGANVVACSDSDGYIYDKNGLHLPTIKRLKLDEDQRICEYLTDHPEAIYVEGCDRIWGIPCDIALPCATQNELDEYAAEQLIDNGVTIVAEGANMPCTQEAINLFLDKGVSFGPAQAANAGGVAVSALEMAQNSARVAWSFEQVDQMLQKIMKTIYENSMRAAKDYDLDGNLVAGANIAGFKRVADAMVAQGI
ncbi:NADP-specific glutamate dehydrogenase [Ornithinibacillus sp. 4-3]|uniref:Glutamate dehydrogenase n=1 Tax=Ornithinibacillus sp. 4-3 TaxID=3231488 RepID=A0AB39HQ24_9BACI